MNPHTWAALQDAGFDAGDTLEIETFFFAPNESAATALVAELAQGGWSVQVTSYTRGVFKKRTEWGAMAARKEPVDSVSQLDTMVAQLEEVAAKHGADFDGWGAEVPG